MSTTCLDSEKVIRDMLRWRSSFIAFLFDCIQTTDEGTAEVRPAPQMAYLAESYRAIEGNKTTILVKSRQMFFTHFMSAYYLWMVIFQSNCRLGIMNQKEEDAADLLDTRIRPLYERLPEGYPWPDLEIKRLTIVNELNNSRIVAFSSSADATRGKTFTRIWLDEFGFQENQERTLRAALPAVKGPEGKLIIVSTPVPKTEYEMLANKEIDSEFEPIERMQGVTEYRNTRGHCVLYVHHMADPAKRGQEWIDATIKAEGDMAYEIEYNLKWLLPRGKPVFSEFRRDVYCKKLEYDVHSPLHVGWDFGGHHPAAVMAQRDGLGRLCVLKAVMGYDEDLYQFMDRIDDVICNEFPNAELVFYCDPAGKAKSGQGTAPPAQQLLQQRFRRKVRSLYSKPADRVRAIKQLMGKLIGGSPGLLLAPLLGEVTHPDGKRECGLMIEGFETGLIWDASNSGVHKMTYKKDGWYEHLFDAFGYMFIFLYPGYMPPDWQDRKEEASRTRPKQNVLRR